MQISGVDLIRWGDKVVVHAEIDGGWVEVIRAPISAIVGAYSHIVDEPQLRKLNGVFKALEGDDHVHS